MEPAAFRSILAALHAEFPYVYAFAYARGHADLLLLAARQPLTRDVLPRWERLDPAVRDDLRRIGVFDTADLWTLMVLGPDDVAALAARAPVANSDDNLLIELGAPWMLYEETVDANWQDFRGTRRGVVPLLEAMGEPLDASMLAALATSYVRAREDTEVAAAVLADAARAGRTAPAITSAVEIGRKLDEEKGAFALDDQIASVDDAIALAPDDLAARLLRGRLLLEAGRAADALADAEVAQRLAPGDPRPVILRGRALLEAERSAEASQMLRAFVGTELAWSDPTITVDAIRASAAAGDGAGATALLESTLRVQLPAWHDGWMMLAELYDDAGRDGDAARARRNADITIKNRAAQYRHDALAAEWSGTPDEAINNFAAALRIDPDDKQSEQDLERLLNARSSPSSP
jgi:tetratricopeptide (TPR) repeat protein